MNVVATVAKFSPVTQVILSVAGLIVGTALLYGIRQAVKIMRGARAALDHLVDFTRAVDAQTTSRAEIDAITVQLGTLSRRPNLQSLEDYIHDFRHDWNNSATVQQGLIATQVKMLERTSDVLDRLIAALGRLPSVEGQRTL